MMKLIIIGIAALVLSLSNLTTSEVHIISNDSDHLNVKQDDTYMSQTLIIDSETIADIRCASCHGNVDASPNLVSLFQYLQTNFDASLIVHQENHPQHISGLEQFLNTHNEDGAWGKYVDHHKVLDIVKGG